MPSTNNTYDWWCCCKCFGENRGGLVWTLINWGVLSHKIKLERVLIINKYNLYNYHVDTESISRVGR
jgi:hypothetical protein